MALFELNNIEKTYPDGTRALRGASFEIKKGEFVAIMGPSGSGKSTLLHIMGFLDRQTEGVYRFEGHAISDYSDEELARVRNEKMGFIFQLFHLLPKTTVAENVKLPLIYSTVPKSEWNQKAENALAAVGLTHRMNHEAYQLSGGEKQRTAIARALVNEPDVVFADEPTGNLDSKSGKIVMETLQDLNDKGHTVVLITHETYTAEHAERILYMEDGQVMTDGHVDNRRRAKDDFQK